MERAIAFARVIGDVTRLRIVAALRQQELCVCELCDALEVTQSTLSTHLSFLRENGVVGTRKEGRWIYYRLAREVKRPIDAIYASFADIESNPRIARDRERIGRRLKLRDDGQCIRGFDQLNTRSKRKAA